MSSQQAFSSAIQRSIATITDETNALTSTEFESIQELITGCSNEEVRANSGLFASLCHNITEYLLNHKKSVVGIDIMIQGIQKLQAHSCQLTSIHSDLVQLCLDSKCLNSVVPFLELDYTDIHKEDGQFEIKHVIMYHYYGGMVYAALKHFNRAAQFFDIVLTLPLQSVTHLMIEAYKKHILLALLNHGKLPEHSLPKSAPVCIAKHEKSVGPAYCKLAQEYVSLNYDKIHTSVLLNESIYDRDENLGLVKQCLAQVRKRNIKRLTKTFVTLSLRDVANHVGLETEREAEAFILDMIDDNEIFASIDQRSGMVVFEDNPEKYDSTIIFQKLQSDMDQSITLIQVLRKMNAAGENSSSLNKTTIN